MNNAVVISTRLGCTDVSPQLACRVCRSIGAAVAGCGAVPLRSIPILPRCLCATRGSNLQLLELPGLPALSAQCWDGAEMIGAMAGHAVGARAADNAGHRRPVYSMDQQPTSREIMVYDTLCSDEGLLGSIVIATAHKISDVPSLL